jgi:hypothetical protein
MAAMTASGSGQSTVALSLHHTSLLQSLQPCRGTTIDDTAVPARATRSEAVTSLVTYWRDGQHLHSG